MELMQWADLIKSLVTRSQPTLISASVNNALFLFIYAAMILVAPTRQLKLSFLCFIVAIFTARSVVYDLIAGWQLHVIYSIIYLIAVPYIYKMDNLSAADKFKAMAALASIAVFNCFMAWDNYQYAKVETYLFIYYESITALLHTVVIASSADWGRIFKLINNTANRLLLICRYSCSFLHIRHLLRYNK